MTREIKFRAKAKNYDPMVMPESGWVDGYFYKDLYGGEMVSFIKNSEMDWDVDPETIGQFTGLHDKNGKEIYEGDIVQWEVCVADYTFVTEKAEVYYDERTASFEPLNEFSYCSFEVIGNAHDNPELLK